MRSWIAAALLGLCLPLHAADAPEWVRVFSVPVKASTLINGEVRNGGNQRLGRLADLVFDLQNNRVHHAIVELREGRRPFPMHMLELAPGRSHLVLDVAQNPVWRDWNDARLVPASRLTGGLVVDVVIDAFWGNVPFAAVELGGALRPLPLDALELKGGAPALRIDPAKAAAIEGFTRKQLDEHLTDREFLRRNARLAHQLTPLR